MQSCHSSSLPYWTTCAFIPGSLCVLPVFSRHRHTAPQDTITDQVGASSSHNSSGRYLSGPKPGWCSLVALHVLRDLLIRLRLPPARLAYLICRVWFIPARIFRVLAKTSTFPASVRSFSSLGSDYEPTDVLSAIFVLR